MVRLSSLHTDGYIRATHPIRDDKPRLSDHRKFDKYIVSKCLSCDHEHCSGSERQFRKCMNLEDRT